MMPKRLAFLVCALATATPASAQAPFVDGVTTPTDNSYDQLQTNVWLPIPGTSKTVDLPAGRGVLDAVLASFDPDPNNSYRLVVGNQMFSEFRRIGDFAIGSFIIDVPGGVTEIRFEYFRLEEAGTPAVGSDQWSLIVFPETFQGVPAIGTWGLVAMLLALTVGASLILLSNRAEARGV